MKSTPLSTTLFPLFFAVVLCSPLRVQAESPAGSTVSSADKPALPNGEILKPLPPTAQWAIIYAAPNAKLPAASAAPTGTPTPKVRILVVTKTGTTRREVETDGAGQSWVRWVVDGHEISYNPDGQYAVSEQGTRNDFTDFDWISAKNYVSTAKVGTQDCYIFQDTITRPDYLQPVKVTAAVDMQTQLPVYFILGTAPRTYKFGTTPASLVVPPEVAAIAAGRPKLADSSTPR